MPQEPEADPQLPEQFAPYPTISGNFSVLNRLQDEDGYIGTISLFFQDHHLFLMRVTRTEDGVQVATCDPHNRLEPIWTMADGYCATVEVEGLPGEWVCWVEPFGG